MLYFVAAPQQNWGAPAARPAAASPAKKPWAPPQGPRNPGSARFGKKGDAQFRKTSDAGRVPVCNTCGQAIRYAMIRFTHILLIIDSRLLKKG